MTFTERETCEMKFKSKFKVGDRVNVYGPGWNVLTNKWDESLESPWSATVISLQPQGQLELTNDLYVYEKQCRKLVKKSSQPELFKFWNREAKKYLRSIFG